MDLRETIRAYYWANFEKLSVEKQFHFAGRLALWQDDRQSLASLAKMRGKYVSSSPEDERVKLLEVMRKQPALDTIIAGDIRGEFFKKYPELYGLELALFRIRHLLVFYSEDYRALLLELATPKALQQLRTDLLNDAQGLRILSTYAVNYLYLGSNLGLLPQLTPADILSLYNLGGGYDKRDPVQLRLYTYLFTHCIIADTNFYSHAIPVENNSIYKKMLERLTDDVAAGFNRTTLDVKLEYLVCCKIIGYTSPLTEQIMQEASQNISGSGTFIVEPRYPQDHPKNSFEGSEHRNVLFIMSGSDYVQSKT